MPLPSREQTFAFANCRELLQKLDREIGRYREVAGQDGPDGEPLLNLVDQLRDSAFNASVTAWQLGDWVFNDMTPDQRQRLGFRSLGNLQDYLRKNCRALYLCRQAATASKHWAVTQHHDPTVQVMVIHDNGWVIYFVHDGNEIAADQIFNEALAFWTGFIYQHQIAKASDDV